MKVQVESGRMTLSSDLFPVLTVAWERKAKTHVSVRGSLDTGSHEKDIQLCPHASLKAADSVNNQLTWLFDQGKNKFQTEISSMSRMWRWKRLGWTTFKMLVISHYKLCSSTRLEICNDPKFSKDTKYVKMDFGQMCIKKTSGIFPFQSCNDKSTNQLVDWEKITKQMFWWSFTWFFKDGK